MNEARGDDRAGADAGQGQDDLRASTVNNKTAYESKRAMTVYARRTTHELTPQEKYCLNLIPPSARGAFLDIGIGAGRTSGPLSDKFESYIGIDYSNGLVASARERYPSLDLRVMDARDLDFESGTFDCGMFSFNGIDSVGPEDRQKIWREIHRVIKPGGLFIVSTHNLGHLRVHRWMTSLFVRELFFPIKQVRFILNRLHRFWRQTADDGTGIAYVNDPGLGFRLFNAYVDIPRELEGLKALGFRLETSIGNTRDSAGFDENDCWVHMVLRKT